MDTKNIYNNLKEMLCSQDMALKELVFTIARSQKLVRPKNILLVGGVGTGKTTMVECTAKEMGVSLAKVSGFCTSTGLHPIVLNDAFTKLFCENKDKLQGIVLIEDMRECFIYGGFKAINSLITSGNFIYNKHLFDISKVMFIGEVDTNDLEECFCEKENIMIDNIEDVFLPENFDSNEICNIIENIVLFDEENVNPSDIYSDQYKEAIRRVFLSIDCKKVFGLKIYMDDMQTNDICKALKSPISELHTYSDDLCEEYINSPAFVYSVASHIRESLVGLHDLDDAVRDVASFDSKRKIKVYKNNSLMRI